LHSPTNCYWCIYLQDGAENGYGAKAAEILDQVRGRFVISRVVIFGLQV